MRAPEEWQMIIKGIGGVRVGLLNWRMIEAAEKAAVTRAQRDVRLACHERGAGPTSARASQTSTTQGEAHRCGS
jgi:hypothetical protein